MPYNESLKAQFESFKSQMEKHKESLEQKIREYIQKINKSLTSHSSCVDQLITKISQNISNLGINYSNIDQFKYTREEELRIPCTYEKDTTPFRKIFEAHREYKQCLEGCYLKIKCELNRFICDFKNYNYYINFISNSINKPDKIIKDPTIIYQRIYNLKFLKSFYLDKFNNYITYVQKLEEIGTHIKTMKSELAKVKGNVVDEGAKTYIQGLQNIDIKREKVQEDINKIKNMNNLVVVKLKIAKHTIDFHNTLDLETSNLSGVTFDTYYYLNNIDYLERYLILIKGKVESFGCSIKPKLCEAKNQIEKIKGQIKEATKDGVRCEDKKLQEQEGDDPITKSNIDIDGPVAEIKSFIDNSLEDIEMIKHILTLLENNKNESQKINQIKSKVGEITKLSEATSNLTQAVKGLEEFVKFQENTRDLINQSSNYQKFSCLSHFSSTFDDIIKDSNNLIGYIEFSSKYLSGITKVDYIIRWINKHYKPRFETIRGIIQNFKLYVKVIIGSLESINSNLCQLKSTLARCCSDYISVNNRRECSSSNANDIGKYKLSRLKEYMKYLKLYLTNIRENVNVIRSVIDKIKKESSYFGRYKRELESLEKYIECYVNRIKCNKNVLKEGVVKQLEEIKDRLNDTISIMIVIENSKSLKCIKSIESRLKCVELGVTELECAIEGVAGKIRLGSKIKIKN